MSRSIQCGYLVLNELSKQYSHMFPWVPVFYGVGIGMYFAQTSEPSLTAILVLLSLLGGLWAAISFFKPNQTTWISPIIWAVTLIILGFCVACFHSHRVAAPVLKFRYYGPVEGRIVKIDRSASQKVRLTLDQVRISRLEPRSTPELVRISLHGNHDIPSLDPGDVVMTTAHLGPPSGPVEPGGFDFQRHLWFQKLGALGYSRVPVLRVSPALKHGWSLQLYSFRQSLSDGIKKRMSKQEGPFAAAIITGERSDIDEELLNELRASNLAHLLAISGLHMGLLTGAIFTVVRLCLACVPYVSLRFCIRKYAAVFALLGAAIYLGISGANVATQRAFVMVSVMLIAICFERPAISLRAVAIAAIIILSISPQGLVGPGFQMSFAATTALVAVFSLARDRNLFSRLPRWVSGPSTLVLSSFIAGMATAPYGAAHFNQLAHYGLLANILSVPVMGIIVMPGALIAACLTPFGLEGVGLWIMEQGLLWILGVASYVSALDGSTSKIISPAWYILPLTSFGSLVLCLWQGTGRLVGLVPVFIALFTWQNTERPAVLIAESGRLIGVLQDGKRGLNKPKGDGFSARVWLENDGDRATQIEALSRSGFSANLVEVSIGQTKLMFNAANPNLIDVIAECKRADFLILPRVESELPPDCEGLSAASFKKFGSVAIYQTAKGIRYEHSRTLQGDRLWVNRQ